MDAARARLALRRGPKAWRSRIAAIYARGGGDPRVDHATEVPGRPWCRALTRRGGPPEERLGGWCHRLDHEGGSVVLEDLRASRRRPGRSAGPAT